jgi:hypothetical protein
VQGGEFETSTGTKPLTMKLINVNEALLETISRYKIALYGE